MKRKLMALLLILTLTATGCGTSVTETAEDVDAEVTTTEVTTKRCSAVTADWHGAVNDFHGYGMLAYPCFGRHTNLLYHISF